MDRYDIRVSQVYQCDLRTVLRYISRNLDAPYTAVQLLDSIESAVENLAVMPARYPLVEDPYLREKNFRTCSVKNYVIFYKISEENKTVCIHRLLHAKQNWISIL